MTLRTAQHTFLTAPARRKAVKGVKVATVAEQAKTLNAEIQATLPFLSELGVRVVARRHLKST